MTAHASSSPFRGVELDGVTVRRDRVVALDDVSFSVDPGTVTAVIGPNGAGKSTMFAVISGRMEPTTGAVRTSGEVADVLQSTAIDPQLSLTVEDVVRMGRYSSLGPFRRFRGDDRRAVASAMERLGVTHLRRRPITELSGGQQQRVLVAQGIVQDAPVLILDEPAAGLDVSSQQQILDVMREEAAAGRTVIFSTHQLSEADQADNVVALDCRCVCCAPPSDALTNPDVRQLFGRTGRRSSSN